MPVSLISRPAHGPQSSCFYTDTLVRKLVEQGTGSKHPAFERGRANSTPVARPAQSPQPLHPASPQTTCPILMRQWCLRVPHLSCGSCFLCIDLMYPKVAQSEGHCEGAVTVLVEPLPNPAPGCLLPSALDPVRCPLATYACSMAPYCRSTEDPSFFEGRDPEGSRVYNPDYCPP